MMLIMTFVIQLFHNVQRIRIELLIIIVWCVHYTVYIPYKMKYWQRVNFGDWQFIKKSPIFNPSVIMNVCHFLMRFIYINFGKVLLNAFHQIILSSYTVYIITAHSYVVMLYWSYKGGMASRDSLHCILTTTKLPSASWLVEMGWYRLQEHRCIVSKVSW